jgi:uncharacterized protein
MTTTTPDRPPTLSDLRRRRGAILGLSARHGASNVRVFGSVARGDAQAGSDVDLLVELAPGRSLMDLGALLMDLSDLLGVDVDLVTERGLTARIRHRILAEALPV